MEGNKKFVFVLLVLVVGSLSGCLGSEKQSSEEDYWEHIRISGELVGKTREIWSEMLSVARDDDLERAIELAKEARRLDIEANGRAKFALELTNNPKEKKWFECLKITTDLFVIRDQKMLEAFQFKKNSRDEEASKSIKAAFDFDNESLRQLVVCEELKPS